MNLTLGSLNVAETATFAMTWIGQALVYGTLLAGATFLLAKLAGRRVHPAVHGALWLVVLLKFVVPVGPASPLSLASFSESAIEYWPFAGASAAEAPASGAGSSSASGLGGELLIERPLGDSAGVKPTIDWLTVVAIMYALSVLVVATLRLRAYVRFASKCRNLPLADPSTIRLVDRVCRTAHLHRRPVVRWSSHSTAPFVFGTLRPTLVLSRRQLRRPEELEAVILHEVAHLRRGDLLIRYVQWFAGTVLFFWPVVAWVNRRIDLALEHACDEWALRHGRITAGQYARCLLEAVSVRSGRRLGWFEYRPAAMAANVSFLERRIDMILETRTQRRTTRLMGLSASLLLIGWAAIALSGGVAAEAAIDGDDTATFVFEGEDPHVVIDLIGDDYELAKEEYAKHKVAFAYKREAMKLIELREVELMRHRADVLADYSQTDLNEDGELSQIEFAAFLVAQAVSDPYAVMEQFEDADRNDDGELDEDEAVRLVSPHLAIPFGLAAKKMLHHVYARVDEDVVPVKLRHFVRETEPEPEDGQAEFLRVLLEPVTEPEPESYEVTFDVVFLDDFDGDGDMDLYVADQADVAFSDDTPAEHGVVTLVETVEEFSFRPRHNQWQIATDVALWLLENIDYDPSSYELNDYAKLLNVPLVSGALHHIVADRVELVLDSSANVEASEGHWTEVYFGDVELVFEAELEDDDSEN